jgi:hypothetical protein
MLDALEMHFPGMLDALEMQCAGVLDVPVEAGSRFEDNYSTRRWVDVFVTERLWGVGKG